MDRYKTQWYQKRITENSRIKTQLIKTILAADSPDLPWKNDPDQLYWLNYEDLAEIAGAAVNPAISICLGEGQDWSNGVDSKTSIVRTHNYGKSYSAGVKCRNKTRVAATVYESIQDQFYYFDLPCEGITEISIPFDPQTGLPLRKNTWWQHECSTFEEMMRAASEGTDRQRKQGLLMNLLFEQIK